MSACKYAYEMRAETYLIKAEKAFFVVLISMRVYMIIFACVQEKQRESGAGKNVSETKKREKKDIYDVGSRNVF